MTKIINIGLITAMSLFIVSCGEDAIDSIDSSNDTEAINHEKWGTLPPSGKYSPGIIEIPAKNHTPPRHVNMFAMVITDNYLQHHDGTMEFVNYHRYGEIFTYPRENLKDATLIRIGDDRDPAVQFEIRQDYRSFFFEGWYFANLEHLNEEVPGEEYRFDMVYDDGREMSHTVNIPAGETPGPVSMSIFQDDVEVSFTDVDHTKPLTVRWTNFSEAGDDPNGIFDDFVTISVNNCGDHDAYRIWVSGEATLNDPYLTYKSKEAVIPVGVLRPGEWFWLEGEFGDVVATSMFDNAPSYSTYLNSVMLDISTKGAAETSYCTESMPRFNDQNQEIK